MRVIAALLWIGVIIGSLLGCLLVFGGLTGESNAIQQAGIIALGIACAVLPYCIARAVTEIIKIDR